MKAKSSQLLSLAFFVGLLSFAAYSQAEPKDASHTSIAPIQMADASMESDDDEEDEEEEAVDYRDRVREIQDWMNRRGSERKGDAPSLNVAPVAPPQTFPKYFRDNGYDESGRRRLDDDVRIKLRAAPGVSYTPHHHTHYSWHKRWYRHVRPYTHAHNHHVRHSYRPSYSHHSHSGGNSRHSPSHRLMKGGGHEKKQAVKGAPQMSAAKSQAHHSKPVSNPAKKGRSRR